MFMDAVSLQNHLTGSVDEDTEEVPSEFLWDYKLEEAEESGLYDSIETDGVKHPVTIYEPSPGKKIMGDGHHRVAVAAHLQRESGRHKYIPVIHDERNYMATKGDWWTSGEWWIK